jgi:Uncharacterized protein conserved in bacteria
MVIYIWKDRSGKMALKPEAENKMPEDERAGRMEQAAGLAGKVMQLARDNIVVNMRFLEVALSRMKPEPRPGTDGAATDGEKLYYDPVWLLKRYKEEKDYPVRLYLHMLFHCVFYHSFTYDEKEQELWNLAADAAVENVILEMGLHMAVLETDAEARNKLHYLKEDAGVLTAERIYRYLKNNPVSDSERAQWHRLFHRDGHVYWRGQEQMTVTEEQWKKISERIKADLKSFSKDKSNSESLEKNLAEATKDRYDYAQILQKFTVMGEDMQVNDDEFDYIYYTYGLSEFGNMPLVEPLEYKDTKKVKEFVIAIDTSASCRGEIVREFVRKTYSILKGTENFFQKINVHIVQCDSEVQSDMKITGEEDFEEFMRNGKLKGFGSTDFRPVFEYVDQLAAEGEFENLKGLIYFTDGYGIYPAQMPEYDTIFVFLDENGERPELPPWAIGIVLNEDEIGQEKEAK